MSPMPSASSVPSAAIERMRPTDNLWPVVQLELGVLLYQLDDPSLAEPHLTEVPGHPTALSLLGDLAQARGDHPLAAERFRQAMENARTADEQLKAAYRLAWILATSPDDAVRDGAAAEELASRLVEATSGASPHMLLALAAAQAESGRFEQAIETAQRAAERARLTSLDELADTVGRQLERYRANKPWRETGIAPQ